MVAAEQLYLIKNIVQLVLPTTVKILFIFKFETVIAFLTDKLFCNVNKLILTVKAG